MSMQLRGFYFLKDEYNEIYYLLLLQFKLLIAQSTLQIYLFIF